MHQLLHYFILIPLLGFAACLFVPRKKENMLAWVCIVTVSVHLLALLIFVTFWLLHSHPALDVKHMTVFKNADLEIYIDYYFDKITAIYALTGSLLTFLVVRFSRYFLHREAGFKRFFSKMLLFYLGYNIIIFSGNFETLFVGWELIGISSFLLIAFYRDRYLPVKNGFKVISLYRFSDICLLLAMWLSHHFWHKNIAFSAFNDTQLVSEQFQQYYSAGICIAALLLVAAAVKSAQFPFSSWLPRAMEGPTTSSAIFYGSLSAHIGVFILLRTYPFWENQYAIKIPVIVLGLFTALVADGISRVQSSVKAQIAYSSVTQIGFIFIEVALGFHNLALVHFMGNAFLRTYQLLVSPSVLSYLVHKQFYTFDPDKPRSEKTWFVKWRNTFYILCTKEWNMDSFLSGFLWRPLKWAGRKLGFITQKTTIILFTIFYFLGLFCSTFEENIPKGLSAYLPFVFSVLALLLLLKAFTEKGSPKRAWILVFSSQFFTALSIVLNGPVDPAEILIYFGGTWLSAIAGYICLDKMQRMDKTLDLNRFYGYAYEHPKLAFVFLLSCLGILGFPITSTFIGVDLLFTHIRPGQPLLAICTGLGLALVELSVLRIYCRIFLGPHKKTDHPMAYRSS